MTSFILMQLDTAEQINCKLKLAKEKHWYDNSFETIKYLLFNFHTVWENLLQLNIFKRMQAKNDSLAFGDIEPKYGMRCLCLTILSPDYVFPM